MPLPKAVPISDEKPFKSSESTYLSFKSLMGGCQTARTY